MNYACRIVGFAILAGCACAAFAEDPAIEAFRDVQQLAACTKALDAACVIRLSDAARYELMAASEAHFHFAQSQSRFYAALRRIGAQYTRFDVYPPTAMFSGDNSLYAFVPYLTTLEIPGRPVNQVRAFLIAISRDAGGSWKFVDAEGVTSANLLKIIPSYGGQPLPAVRVTELQ